MKLTTSARLALVNSGLVAASFAGLLLLVTWLADRFMVNHVQESVQAELNIMLAELRGDGQRGAVALIEQRMQAITPNHDRVYRFESSSGQLLAGNLDRWPQTTAGPGGPFKIPSRKYPGETEVISQWTRLSDGGRLLVGFDDIELAQVRSDIRDAALWGLGATLLLSLGVGFSLIRAALKPVEAIRAAALRFMEGERDTRIPVQPSGDEFDRLSETLNSMLDRIDSLIASVKGATDTVAHDLRSPLTRLRVRLEAALRDPPTSQELQPWIEKNLAEVDQVLATFQALLRISSVESSLLRQEFAPCDVGQLVRDAVDYIEPLAEEKGQRLEVTSADVPMVLGHKHLLFQLLINLLDNAVKYAPSESMVCIRFSMTSVGWQLEVADSGAGIPTEHRSRVFERLYRLDASRQTPGLGLGLSLVKAIADMHRASIVILDNKPGTRVVVTIPKRFNEFDRGELSSAWIQ